MILKAAGWLSKAMEQLNCSVPVDVTSVECKKKVKDKLAVLLNESFHLVRFQNEKLRQMKTTLNTTRNKLIENQQWVISLQEQVIDCKDKQLQAVQTTVKTSVQDCVQEQFKSYSDAVQENVMVCKPESVSPGTLQQVVRSVVQEEDRAKNVIIFGVQEQDQENLKECVMEVFDEMKVRPAIHGEISRIGKKRAENSVRPIKVKLSSSSTASLVLGQARLLRQSEIPRLKSVFVNPDRSEEDRAQRRLLVQDLKDRRNAEPGKRHYIRGGIVHSEDVKPKK